MQRLKRCQWSQKITTKHIPCKVHTNLWPIHVYLSHKRHFLFTRWITEECNDIFTNTHKLKWHAFKHFSLLTVRLKSRFNYIFHSISMRQKFYLRKYGDTITPLHIQRKTNSAVGPVKSITWQKERTHATRNSKCQGSTFQLHRVIAEDQDKKLYTKLEKTFALQFKHFFEFEKL